MQITWSSSLNHWRNYKRRWSSGRLTWKERDFGSTWAKPRSWFLGQDSRCFGNPAKTPVVCVSKTSAQAPFSVFFFFFFFFFSVGCTRDTVVSLALWSRIPALCVNGVQDRTDQMMGDQWQGEELEVVLSFCYQGGSLYSGGGCELTSITRCRVKWGKFNEFLSIFTPRSYIITSTWRVYICASEAPCSTQAKPGPQPCVICIACNAITELWSARCVAPPSRTKSARKIPWTGCSLMMWQR